MMMSSPIRIVFIGAVDFSRHCLKITLATGGHVVGIMAPLAESAKENSDFADLSQVAADHGIPFSPFKRIGDPDAISQIEDWSPDIVFVFGLSQLLPPRILALPRLGVIGAHPTLLPEGRGRHPLVWTLVKGLTRGGLTFFYMDSGADTGDILWQKPFDIGPDDDAGILYEKIKQLASDAIPNFLPLLASGTAPRIPQKHENASIWPKRGEKDGEIDWNAPSREIHNLIRALTHPYVGAHTYVDDKKMIVWKSRLPEKKLPLSDLPPGTILQCRAESLTIRASDGTIELTDWHVPVLLRENAVLRKHSP